MDGLVLVDKPAGKTSHDVTLAVRRGARRAPRRPRRHAGPVRHRAAARARRPRAAGAALPDGAAQALRHRRAPGRAVDDRRPARARSSQTGRIPPDAARLPTGPSASARRSTRRCASRARRPTSARARGEDFEMPEREVTVYRFEELWRDGDRAASVIECSAGTYVRSLIADLGDAYCEALRRTAIGPFASPTPTPTRVLALERRARASCRGARWTTTPARRAAPRPAVAAAGAEGAGEHVAARRRRRPGRDRRAADGRRAAQARRRLPRVMRHPRSPRRRAAPAPRRGRHLRRRPPRPPRGDRRRRHRR